MERKTRRATRETSTPAPKAAAPAAPARLFDARPDRLDLRDVPYQPPLRSLPPIYPLQADVKRFIGSYIDQDLVLDQGSQGACTGFGLACVANYLLWTQHLQSKTKVPFLPVSPRMLYELARRYDEWPGTDYEGSSCRGALKGWHKHGVCGAAFWPYQLNVQGKTVFVPPLPKWERDAAQRPLGVYYRVNRQSVVDMQAAIVNIGAVFVSANAHDGWDSLLRARARAAPTGHAQLPAIPPITQSKSSGGHAFALVGYNERGFIVQNSWGRKWGASGFAVLPYDDWIVNATDAWACALGVPISLLEQSNGLAQPVKASRWRVASGQSLTALNRATRQPGNPSNDPWPFDHPFNNPAYEPWPTAEAYAHTLVTGNDGELAATDFTRDAGDKAGLATEIVRTKPLQWARSQGANVLKLAVYAHGGLNDELESIQRIRVLGPCFQANGVYPLFLTWKTGAGETLGDMAQDWVRKIVGEEGARSGGFLEALGEAKDRAVEALAYVLGKGVWTEMRENAAGGARVGHGLDLLTQRLVELKADLQAVGLTLEVHLVGHSAGSILLGHLLTQLGMEAPAQRPVIASTTLYAAACSVRFANEHYGKAAAAQVLSLSQLWQVVLSDINEKEDGLPTPGLPAYGKSLLYLVSRALDDVRKQPLLGMERSMLPQYANDDDQWRAGELSEVQQWQAAWPASAAGLLEVVALPQVVSTRQGDRIQATHGSFDNNVGVLSATIQRIKAAPLVSELEWLDY
jgi:hypothetical protein